MEKPEYMKDIKTEPLEDGVSLQLYNSSGYTIFQSSGKWLYPLFEVEDHLHAMALDAGELFLHDRIAGRAAASLIVLMGFKKCFIDTLSSHAQDVFKCHGVDYGYNMLVEKIACRTENLITNEMTLDDVYRMLRQRAGRLQGIDLQINDLYADHNGKTVLNGLNLTMRGGEQLVIGGNDFEGKSVLAKVLTGRASLEKGEIILGGESAKQTENILQAIGYMNQDIQTDDMTLTASEFVATGMQRQNLKAAELSYETEIVMRRTGCFYLADRNVGSLTKLEKILVGLARCLARKVGVILMDEPSSFLDNEAKDEFLNVLKNVVRRHMPTIVLLSSDRGWINKLGWTVKTLAGGRLD